jgi:hypothetical protein
LGLIEKQYNLIIEKSEQMPFHTDMGLVFESFEGKQNEYNWLISNIELNEYPEELFERDPLWISGEELTKKLNQFKIQFIWAVFSGFDKNTNLDISNLEVKPYADGNPGFWVENPKIQHPLAKVEIVCFDSSLTLYFQKIKK